MLVLAAMNLLIRIKRPHASHRTKHDVTQWVLAECFVVDPLLVGEAYLGKYLVWESSGTSNQPGIFVQDAQTMGVYDALEAVRRSSSRPVQRWLDPMMLTERMAFFGATSGHFASFVTMQRLREINPWLAPAVQCFSILQIATYATAAAMLADEAERGAPQGGAGSGLHGAQQLRCLGIFADGLGMQSGLPARECGLGDPVPGKLRMRL